MISSFKFSRLLLVTLLATLGCGGSGGSGSPGNGPGPHPVGPNPTCEFRVIDAPKGVEALTPEGLFQAIAYITPSCKTAVIAISSVKHDIVVARYNGVELDKSFGQNGAQRFEFIKDLTIVGDSQVTKVGNRVVMVGVAEHTYYNMVEKQDAVGFFAALFTDEGEFQSQAYDHGHATSFVWTKPTSGVYCNHNYLDTKSFSQDGTVVEVHGEYSNQCSDKVTPVVRRFNTIKPNLDGLQVAQATKCQNYEYKTPGAINSESYEIHQDACRSITLNWELLGYGGLADSDHFTATTDGKCLDTRLYGRSCFLYENGYLARAYLSSTWEIKKQYYAVVQAAGSICDVDGWTGTVLITSSLSPSDPDFLHKCQVH